MDGTPRQGSVGEEEDEAHPSAKVRAGAGAAVRRPGVRGRRSHAVREVSWDSILASCAFEEARRRGHRLREAPATRP